MQHRTTVTIRLSKTSYSFRLGCRNFNIQTACLNAQLSGMMANYGGGEEARTPDPRVANAVLCQLSYTPR